jgi:type II secretory ATPase GspE/PulE/Tfp pilus assembly ATPase PilB-like protein/ActR/RegA family two-component response regulator/predicted RNA-binding Zn-ribbon protein involved in translation (DUF1610 family)
MRTDERAGGGNLALLRFLQRRGAIDETAATALEPTALGRSFRVFLEALESHAQLRERELAGLLSDALRLPLLELANIVLPRELAGALREQVATSHEVVPIRVEERTIEIAIANPLDREAVRAVEFATGRTVRVAIAPSTDIRRAIANLYRLDDSLTEFLGRFDEDGTIEAVVDGSEHDFGAGDTEMPPVVKLADRILTEATSAGASDVHIEPIQDGVVVRYRIDGILEEAFRFPRWLHQPLVGRLKIMAKLDIAERRVPQDGRTRVRVSGRVVDFRVSSLPTHLGEKITLRILDASRALKSLDHLGLPAVPRDALLGAARRPEGMILVTGPTGSGKTTTLYALLLQLRSVTSNIVTIENPVEYELPGINQVDINARQGLTFAGVLRSVLRQDPDVILVGEIRDRETAEVAFQAAQTGHLVLSTVHTNDSISTITRLLDLGIEPYLIASSLHLVMAQRLVRRICGECGEPAPGDETTLAKLPIEPEALEFLRRGVGCQACRGAGYAGRIGIYEALPITTSVGRLIETRANDGQLRDQARRDGLVLLVDDAVTKLREGTTTVEEVLRVVQVDGSLLRCSACRKEVAEEFSLCPHCGTTLNLRCDGCERRLESDWARCPYCGTEAPVVGPNGLRYEPRTFKALVVDDEVQLRSVVRAILEGGALGLTVLTAQDGQEALALAEVERPDLIVIDFSMPGMTGPEVVTALRSNPDLATIPILMLTAHDDDEHLTTGFEAGVDDYVVKPFRRDQLLARVRRLLERVYGQRHVPRAGDEGEG